MARYLSVLMLLVAGQNVVGQAADECAFSEPEKLTASDGASADVFGYSVSISGDYAVIGAYGDDDNDSYSGSAYVFERDEFGNWSETGKLTAFDGAGGDLFGISVSISGEYAVIGAPSDDDNGSASGSAYVFERDGAGNWSERAKLTASDGAASDSFGYSVSISGDYAVIGAPSDDDNGSASGSAYVFERDGAGNWSERAKLTASDGNPYDNFGSSVSISGNYAVIGADGDDDNGSSSGSAYIFERDGAGVWSEVQKLTASDGAEFDYFGSSVSISGEYAVVGAYYDDDNGGASGSAYVFERDGAGNWSERAKLTASDGAASDSFGISVSISGEYAVIGACYDDYNGTNSGSAYVFERDRDGNWSERAKLTASDGAAVDQFGWSVSISGDDAVIGARYDDDNGSSSGSAYAFKLGLEDKLTASDGAEGDWFGRSVSISGDYAVIGADRDDDNGADSGSAYVFERDGAGNWLEVQKLTALDGAVEDRFGYSVSISGEYAVVGAYYDDDNGSKSGSAYVYERDGAGNWSEVQKLTASDGAGGDWFGYSVSISGDYAVVGAYYDDDNGSASGSAYVFERDRDGNWSEVQKLTASDGAGNDRFGYSVSISGDYAVIGAYGDDDNDNGSNSGSAYVFERDRDGNWSERAKLTASDGASADVFGYSVSISGDDAVIGARYDDDNGSYSGSAYVFDRDRDGNWSEVQKLTASDGDSSDYFGLSVSISGDYAVIGARYDDDNGSSSGSAYIFERDGAGVWSEVQKLTACDGAEFDWVGESVSISGDYAVIGAYGDDDNGSNSGSAYVYKIQPGPPVCLGDTNGDLIVNLVDFTQLMVDYGTTGDSRADFNGDNIVDLDDFSILLVNYGNSCE